MRTWHVMTCIHIYSIVYAGTFFFFCMYILRLLKYLPDWCHLCHLSRQYWDSEGTDGTCGRDSFLKVRHLSRNRTQAQSSGSLNLAAPFCAELVC
jgi:hypothetical protein